MLQQSGEEGWELNQLDPANRIFPLVSNCDPDLSKPPLGSQSIGGQPCAAGHPPPFSREAGYLMSAVIQPITSLTITVVQFYFSVACMCRFIIQPSLADLSSAGHFAFTISAYIDVLFSF